jgi:hypothetical protein
MSSSSFDELLFMIRPNITYQNTVMRMSVPPEERLAATLRKEEKVKYLIFYLSFYNICYLFITVTSK